MGMIMHDDVPYGEGTSYTQGTGIAINNNIIAVDADNTPTSGSEKPVKSKGVYEVVEQIYADNGVLGAKNICKYPFINTSKTESGITFTDNGDGSITVQGIATAGINFFLFSHVTFRRDLLLNKRWKVTGGYNSNAHLYFYNIDGNGTSIDDSGSGSEFEFTNISANYNLVLSIRKDADFTNPITIYPMLRLASDPDDTYVPYAMTNKELTDNMLPRAEQRVLGAKNLLPNNATSQTINGVTFTVNDDGSVTANGTATAQAIFWVTGSNNNRYTFDKNVIISGCPSGGSGSTYALGGNNVGIVTDEAVITAGKAISVACVIYSGVTVSNIVFKPMLRLASDPDDTYVPYAMTNRELTEAIASVPTVNNGQLTIQQNGTQVQTFTANASSNKTANIVTGEFIKTASVSNGSVTFTGINDTGTYGYDVFFDTTSTSTNLSPYAKLTSISGEGTANMSLTYETDADNGTNNAKLYQYK